MSDTPKLGFNSGFFVGMAVGMVIALIIISMVVSLLGTETHSQIVEQGHAEFYLDNDHARRWRMLKPCNKLDEATGADDE